jgi:hypothetical protein
LTEKEVSEKQIFILQNCSIQKSENEKIHTYLKKCNNYGSWFLGIMVSTADTEK